MRFAGWSPGKTPICLRGVLYRPAACALLVAAIFAGAGLTTPQSPGALPTLREAAQAHNLLMGTAADADLLSDPAYTSTLAAQYSQLEPENEMKFDSIHPQPATYAYQGADALVAFAISHSMKVSGATLVWQEQVPNWVIDPRAPWTPATLNKALADHIANVVGHFKGKVYAWDVVNEPFNEDGTIRSTVWYNKPGIGFAGQGTKTVEQALRWAHAADPDAKLFVNEYGADRIGPKSDAMYRMAKDFVKRGVPLSGIGFELHVTPSFDDPETLDSLRQNLRRFAALGLEVQFTEVDVQLHDGSAASLKTEASIYKDLLSICLHQPACTAFQSWGFTDRHSWIPGHYHGYGWALPFDQDYKPKPAFYAMLKELESWGNTGPRPPLKH